MKKIISSAVIVVLVGLGGYAYYFVGTPTYSLYKLKSAITDHDSVTFNKYVDIDRVVNNLVDQATSDNSKNSQDSNWGSGLLKSLVTAMGQQIKDSINSSVEDISKGKNDKIATLKIKSVTQEGKSAKVILVNSSGDELAVDMIQSQQRYWIIVGLNADNFNKINPFNIKANLPDSSNTSSNTIDSSGKDQKISGTAKFGDKTTITADAYITINRPEDYTSLKSSYEQPASGNKYVTVEVEYFNETSNEASVTPSNLTLKDSDDHSFNPQAYELRKPGIKDGAVLPAKENMKGYITFEVPADAQIVKAVYANDTATIVFE